MSLKIPLALLFFFLMLVCAYFSIEGKYVHWAMLAVASIIAAQFWLAFPEKSS